MIFKRNKPFEEALKKAKKPSPFDTLDMKKRFLTILFESNPHFVERYGKEERMYSYTLLATAIIAILQLTMGAIFLYFAITAQINPSPFPINDNVLYQDILLVWAIFTILSILIIIPGAYVGRLVRNLERTVRFFTCSICKNAGNNSNDMLNSTQESLHSVINPDHKVDSKEIDTIISWVNATGNFTNVDVICFAAVFAILLYLIHLIGPNSSYSDVLAPALIALFLSFIARLFVVNPILRSRPSNVSLVTVNFSTYEISQEYDLHTADVTIYRVSKRQFRRKAYFNATYSISPEWVAYYLAADVKTNFDGNLKSVIPVEGTKEYEIYKKSIISQED